MSTIHKTTSCEQWLTWLGSTLEISKPTFETRVLLYGGELYYSLQLLDGGMKGPLPWGSLGNFDG